jgi:2',3'-cyclic-nucleotide 2'-phosphodiesterase (5'-nucleotidase family)
LGGLARKSAILNKADEENQTYFVVDAGDLFFKNSSINPGIQSDLAKISADIIVNAFNKIGCDAFNVGEKDFAMGLDYLNELKEQSEFPYISANIKNSSGSFIFNPYKIIERGGIKLGIIGLSSVFEMENIQVDEPIESLKKIVDFVDAQSDFILLLFNASDNDMNRFHNENLAVDFVIQSKSKKRSNDGGKKETPVYSCGDRGKYMYEFDFIYNELGNEFIDIALHESTIKLMDRKIKNLSNQNSQNENTNPVNTQEKLDNFTSQKKEAEDKIATAINKISVNKIALDKTITDDPEILKIVDAGNIKKNSINPQPKTQNPAHGKPGHRHGE